MKTCKPVLRVLAVLLAFACIATAADAPKLTFKFSNANVPRALQTFPGSINNAGVTVGQYQDKKGVLHGYILKGKSLTTLDDPNGTKTNAQGIKFNSANKVVGWYTNSSGSQVGFLYDANTKEFTDILGPEGATNSGAEGINDQGWIVGYYTDSSNHFHGFLLKGKKYHSLDVPGATASFAWGINNKGNIVLSWYDSTYPFKGSLYNYKKKTYIPIKGVPGAGPDGSEPFSINNGGDILFTWYDSSGLEHGALLHGGKYYKFGYPKAYQTNAAGINDKNALGGSYQGKINGPWSGFEATY